MTDMLQGQQGVCGVVGGLPQSGECEEGRQDETAMVVFRKATINGEAVRSNQQLERNGVEVQPPITFER